MSFNKVAVFLPNNFNPTEKERAFNVIQELVPESVLHFSLYQAPEQEILEYIIQLPEDLFPHFHLHLLTKKAEHSEAIQAAFDFFETLGGSVHEHYLPTNEEGFTDRKTFDEFCHEILSSTEETLAFYNGDPKQISKLLRPISLSEEKQQNSYICKVHLDEKIIPYVKESTL